MTAVLSEPEAFVLAANAIDSVVQQIRDDQWSMVMPPAFQTWGLDHPPTLREIVGRHAYDDAWVPDMLAGRTMAEVGEDAYKGDLLGDDPKAAYSSIIGKAIVAAESVTDLTTPVHCSFGDYTVQTYLWQANSFRGLRAREIAEVIGVPCHLPDELVQALWAELRPVADEWRAVGVFPAAVPVAEDAPLLDRLLGLVGQQPRQA